jgi:tetratricopeptide (TPR) repeat protein
MKQVFVVITSLVVVLIGTAACEQPASRDQGSPASVAPQGATASFETWDKAHQLLDQGKPEEAAAIYERILAGHPDDFEAAHLGLGNAHRKMADAINDRAQGASATRIQHLELAATHYRRAFDLGGPRMKARNPLIGPPLAPSGFVELIALLGPDGLNRPAEAEALARAVIKQYPADRTAHFILLDMLLDAGKYDEVDDALRTVHESIPAFPEEYRFLMGSELTTLVELKPKLPVVEARKLLAEAIVLIDERLKIKPDDWDALNRKSQALRVQAIRVEQNADRTKALLAEADRLKTQSDALLARLKE